MSKPCYHASPQLLWPNLWATNPEYGEHIKSAERVNTVVHVTCAGQLLADGGVRRKGPNKYSRGVRRRDMLCGRATVPVNPADLVAKDAARNPNSATFEQNTFNTNHGVFLQFVTGNHIQAGGDGTHASAFLAVALYNAYIGRLARSPLHYPGAIGAPNIVWYVKFKKKINRVSLSAFHRASWSDKFPGIAIHTGSVSAGTSATPEIFPESGKMVIAGMRSPGTVRACLTEVLSILANVGGDGSHFLAEDAPADKPKTL